MRRAVARVVGFGGEFCREAAVLILVFGFLDWFIDERLFKDIKPLPSDYPFWVLGITLGFFVLGVFF